jgi:hypothetical protein
MSRAGSGLRPKLAKYYIGIRNGCQIKKVYRNLKLPAFRELRLV